MTYIVGSTDYINAVFTDVSRIAAERHHIVNIFHCRLRIANRFGGVEMLKALLLHLAGIQATRRVHHDPDPVTEHRR